jgi:hypothetical protein
MIDYNIALFRFKFYGLHSLFRAYLNKILIINYSLLSNLTLKLLKIEYILQILSLSLKLIRLNGLFPVQSYEDEKEISII